MKKNILRLAILCVTILGAYGCALERSDYDHISPDNFYKNESDVKAATTAAYHLFEINSWGGGGVYSHGRGGINIHSEVATDVMDCQWGDGGTWDMFNRHAWTADNSDTAGDFFGTYKYISQFRNIIRNIEKSSVSDVVKSQYIGEVKALRGWLMYLLLDYFGPVPVASDEVLDNPQTEVILETPTEAEYVSMIETELKEAISMLPTRASEWGRIDVGSANMMLLKLYLQQKRWADAEKIGRELTSGKYGYKLLDDYYDCFSLKTEINDENIWSIPCDNETYVNGWVTHTIASDCPYENTAIQRWAGYRMPWAFYNTYEKNDRRLDNIIGEYVSTSTGELVNEKNPTSTLVLGALPLKYTVDPNQKGDRSGIDVPIFRYSDVLLSLAESIARQKAPTQECMDLINKVRNRVGLESYSLTDYSNSEKFFDMLLLERGHELYCEGWRRTDLIRFGKYIEFARQVIGSQTADYKVKYPIPNSYLLEYKGSLTQNPGY